MTTVQLLIIFFGIIGTIISGLMVAGIKDLIATVYKNNTAISLLTKELENMAKHYGHIDQLKKDVNAIGAKLRGDKNNGQD